MVDAIRQIGVSEVTYCRWRQEFGGLKTEPVKRLKDLVLEMVDARDIADVDAAELVRREALPEPLPRHTIEIVGPEAFAGRDRTNLRVSSPTTCQRRRDRKSAPATQAHRRGRRRMKSRDGAFPGHA